MSSVHLSETRMDKEKVTRWGIILVFSPFCKGNSMSHYIVSRRSKLDQIGRKRLLVWRLACLRKYCFKIEQSEKFKRREKLHINTSDILSSSRNECRRRQWHPTPVLLPGKSHGWRSLVGCSPWSHKESDRTEWLHFHFSLSCIGEGNGNPLQCSCLENPRDGGAWWAAVYGVAQSRTRLKWLSSSSSSNECRVHGTPDHWSVYVSSTQHITKSLQRSSP